MFLMTFFRNLTVKYKIILSTYSIIILVSLVLGVYSYKTSETNVVNKVSVANFGMIRQIDSNMDFLQREIEDVSTQLVLNSNIQSAFKNNTAEPYLNDSLNSTLTLVASKSYISMTVLYSLNENMVPYFRCNDGSNGIFPLSDIKNTGIYKRIVDMKGKPLWFPLEGANQVFVENNRYPKIAMARMVRDINSFRNIGMLIMSVNERTIRNIYAGSLQSDKDSFAVVDRSNSIISKSGADFFSETKSDPEFTKLISANREGYFIDKVSGKEMLITYSSNNLAGWTLFYAAPLRDMTREISSIGLFTVIVIIGCLIIIFPLMIMISSVITAPVKKLLKSMKRFQEGKFDEYVEVRSNDELGQLGNGYNNMVTNIKELINKAYILQIKEREAELNALQAQINPHFLYNTLDTIFWKAKAHEEDGVSEMIYSLSRLFRLSLNRGREMTAVSGEKELIEHYLLLQKVRFQNKLKYEISIDPEIQDYVIPKLILQPFVENAILHGIERKKAGGMVTVTGRKKDGKLLFTVEDDGVGMGEDEIKTLLSDSSGDKVNTSVSSGGYAVRNVNERLKLIYREEFSLKFISREGSGTTVEILIPAVEYRKFLEADNV